MSLTHYVVIGLIGFFGLVGGTYVYLVYRTRTSWKDFARTETLQVEDRTPVNKQLFNRGNHLPRLEGEIGGREVSAELKKVGGHRSLHTDTRFKLTLADSLPVEFNIESKGLFERLCSWGDGSVLFEKDLNITVESDVPEQLTHYLGNTELRAIEELLRMGKRVTITESSIEIYRSGMVRDQRTLRDTFATMTQLADGLEDH